MSVGRAPGARGGSPSCSRGWTRRVDTQVEDQAGDVPPEPPPDVPQELPADTPPGEPPVPADASATAADDGEPGPSSRRNGALPIGVTAASLLLPGLGQLALGARRIALIFLVPSLIVLAVVGVWALANGVYGMAAALLAPGALLLLFAGNLVFGGWRAVSALDALRRTHPGRAAAAASILLVVIGVGVPHALAGSIILSTNDFLDSTFAMAPTEEPEPTDSPVPPTPEPTPGPTLAPGATPSPAPSPSPTMEIAPYPTDGGNGTLPAFDAKVPWKRPGVEAVGRRRPLRPAADRFRRGHQPMEPPERRHAARGGGRQDGRRRDDRAASEPAERALPEGPRPQRVRLRVPAGPAQRDVRGGDRPPPGPVARQGGRQGHRCRARPSPARSRAARSTRCSSWTLTASSGSWTPWGASTSTCRRP